MPDTARTRTGLQASAGTDDVRTIDDTMKAAFDQLEALAALDAQGTLASRPAAGKRGLLYWATDAQMLYRDTGSSWVQLTPGPWTTLTLIAAAADDDGYPVPAARFEPGGVVRLRGRCVMTDESAFLATVPAGLRPAMDVTFLGVDISGTPRPMSVSTVGTLSSLSVLPEGRAVSLEGAAFAR